MTGSTVGRGMESNLGAFAQRVHGVPYGPGHESGKTRVPTVRHGLSLRIDQLRGGSAIEGRAAQPLENGAGLGPDESRALLDELAGNGIDRLHSPSIGGVLPRDGFVQGKPEGGCGRVVGVRRPAIEVDGRRVAAAGRLASEMALEGRTDGVGVLEAARRLARIAARCRSSRRCWLAAEAIRAAAKANRASMASDNIAPSTANTSRMVCRSCRSLQENATSGQTLGLACYSEVPVGEMLYQRRCACRSRDSNPDALAGKGF